MILCTRHEERSTLVWTWLGLLGVAVAVPIPWTRVDPIASDASAPYGGDKHVCLLDDVMYRAGDSVATATACEKCVCRPPDIVCTTILCEMRPGCRALQKSNQCCPEYQCECERDGKMYNNGEKLESPENACEVCYCRGGVIVCALITCYTRDDCQPQEVPGRCCPKYDHCPPLDSNNIKLTTTWPLGNASSPSDESAGDVDANSVTVGVTSSRRLSLPGEYRVTRVPAQPTSSLTTTSLSEVGTLPTAEAGDDATTTQQAASSSGPADDNAEDNIAESSEHSPVKIFTLFNVTVLGNETVKENQINRTLDNTVDYEDTAVQGSEIVNVTELADFTTPDGENGTTAGFVDVEATTEVPTTETYSVLATPGVLASSSRAPLSSEPWEEHRPTQMVTDDIQYVTTLDPMVSVVESIATQATTPGISTEAKDNVSLEATSDISISTEKEADATTETADSATDVGIRNEESSTVFEKSLEVKNLNETEGSESESTNSSTQEPPEIFTSMEMLLNEMTAPSDVDEVVNDNNTLSENNKTSTENGTEMTASFDVDEVVNNNNSLSENTRTSTESGTVMTASYDVDDVAYDNNTLLENNKTSTENGTEFSTTQPEPLEREDPEENDSLPVLKLSEEMANHQMDFVIHHIVVPTESDDLEVDVEMMNPVGDVVQSTEAANATEPSSAVTTSGGDDKDDTRTTLLDGVQVQIQNKIDDFEKEITETSTVENVLNVTHVSQLEEGTNAEQTSESDREQQKVILANKEDNTSIDLTDEPEATTQQKTEETLHRGVSDDVTKEVEASIVSTPTSDSLKVEDTEVDSTEKTTEMGSSSSTRTEEAQESTDLATSNVTPLTSTSDSLSQDIIRSNIIAEDVAEFKTNNSKGDDEENVTLSEGSLADDNSTESLPTTEAISNTTLSIAETEFDIIQDSVTFQSNKITGHGQEDSSSLPIITVNVIGEDPTSTTEERHQNTTVIFVTDEPTEITHLVTSSLVLTPSEGDDNSPRPDVKRETIFLTSFPPEENSALTPSSNSENKFAALQREDAEEISKYDLALLQNFFKNLYIHDDDAIVAVT